METLYKPTVEELEAGLSREEIDTINYERGLKEKKCSIGKYFYIIMIILSISALFVKMLTKAFNE